jgi:hypothetical protein
LSVTPSQRGLPRPSAEELAEQLLADAEFGAIRLGTFLDTPDGELLVTAVELVSPPFYRDDIELLVAALKLAARIQQRQQRLGGVLIGAAAVALVASFARG